MMIKFKRTLLTFAGFFCLLIGLVFILLPGPAILFLPLGLALLSLEFDWAKVWLRRCQRWMRVSAIQMDKCFLAIRTWLKKRKN
jgi:hypothetical protein